MCILIAAFSTQTVWAGSDTSRGAWVRWNISQSFFIPAGFGHGFEVKVSASRSSPHYCELKLINHRNAGTVIDQIKLETSELDIASDQVILGIPRAKFVSFYPSASSREIQSGIEMISIECRLSPFKSLSASLVELMGDRASWISSDSEVGSHSAQR